MASTNGLQNNALVVNTIDGLTTLYATSIYDNGQAVDPGSYVPYTGALFNVDLNNNQLNDVNSLQVNSSIAAASLTTTGLITTNTLKINSVPSGTQTSLLAVDSSGNVIQGSSPTQIQINAGLTNGTSYYLTFVPSNTGLAKNESLYTEAYYNGYEIQYSPASQTLSVLNMDIEGQVKIPNLGSSASPSYYVGLNATNQMVKVSSVSAQPNITQVSASGTYYPVFVNSNSAQSGATIYVDPLTSPLAYTYSSQTLTCKNLTVSGTTTIAGYATLASPAFTGTPTAPTAASGTNTTQLATTAFVTIALSNYIPLQGSIAGLNLNAYLGGSTSKFNIYSSTSPYTLLLGIQQATSPYVTADSLAVTNSFTVGGASVITSTGTTTGVNNIIKLAGTSAQFIIQSSTGGALLSVRQSATPYVGIDSLNVTNALAVGTTSTFTGAITASSDLTVTGTVYGVSYAGSLIANMVFNSPGGGKNIVFQYAGTPILTLSSGSAVFYNGFVYADAGAGALILGVNGSSASNLALTASSSTFNAPILSANTSGYGQITLCQNTSTGYGVIQRNDGANMYWLVTNVNNPTGSWNSYRPLAFNLSNGQLRSENSQVFLGGTYVDTLNFNSGGQIGSNSGTTYGSFSATVAKNGWYGMSMWNNRHYVMSDETSTFGLYDQAYNWLVRGINGALYFDSIPYQNYNPGYILLGSSGNGIQYGQMNLTNYYYTGTWGGGASLGSISKGQTNSVFWLTGMSSYYVSTAAAVYLIIRLYNTSSGSYYYYANATMFTNVTYNHVSYPINVGIYSLPAGTYNIYVYLNGSYITDVNDYIYLSFRVTP